MEPLPEPEEDELIRLGRQWTCGQNETAEDDFQELASDLMRNGQAQRVLDSCHRLLGEESDSTPEIIAELTAMIQQARQSLVAAMN